VYMSRSLLFNCQKRCETCQSWR